MKDNKMNSRERVLTALNHKQPDRVAIDLSGHRSSGISAIAYSKLRKHLGLEEKPIRIYDMVQQLAVVDNDVLDYFSVDVVEMGRGFCLDDKDWKDWVLPDDISDGLEGAFAFCSHYEGQSILNTLATAGGYLQLRGIVCSKR